LIQGRYTIWQDLALPNFFPESNITFVTTVDEFSYTIEAQPENTTMTRNTQKFSGIFIPILRSLNELFFSQNGTPIHYFAEVIRIGQQDTQNCFNGQLAAPITGERVVVSGEATSYPYYGFLQGAYFEVAQCPLSTCRTISPQGVLHSCNGL